MECIGVGSITTTTQMILDNNQYTIILVLLIPVIESTVFFFSKTTRTSSDLQQKTRSSRLECQSECVDCITGITSTNKIVYWLLSRII
jgi:hypothetical protein